MDHINPDNLRDQPLFLDEPPQPPKRVQPDTSHLDGLFADEDTVPAFVGRGQAHGGLSLRDAWQAVAGSSSDAQARSYARTSLFIALILTAVAIGFAAARAFLN